MASHTSVEARVDAALESGGGIAASSFNFFVAEKNVKTYIWLSSEDGSQGALMCVDRTTMKQMFADFNKAEWARDLMLKTALASGIAIKADAARPHSEAKYNNQGGIDG